MSDPAHDAGPVGSGAVGQLEWVDNHCHLDPEHAPDTVADARAAGVAALVTVGTDEQRSRECLAVAAGFGDVWATAGVHPHDATEGIAGLVELVDAKLADGASRLVAIGECGLDFHYDHSPRDTQREVFARQVELAQRSGLPLVVHTREAWEETFDVLESVGVPERTVFHCFTGGPDEAGRCVELGAHLSISGIVTFKSAQDVRDAVAATPLGRLMVETDSPYLAPVPFRGQRNRPALVARVGQEVADVLGLDVSEVAAATTATARRFYGLHPSASERV